ncbi:MAG TPA: hypothetical protein VN893_21170, partial [Bryobacteraceae bacterium]|nr:hypothetical protein [Bryobacteraceae bacterium]
MAQMEGGCGALVARRSLPVDPVGASLSRSATIHHQPSTIDVRSAPAARERYIVPVSPLRPSERFRIQDAVWLALFAIMAATGPTRRPEFILLLFALAVIQVLEQKIPFFAPVRGSVLANLLKLVLGYAILSRSGDINSPYFWILLVPVVSAATTLGEAGTVSFTVLACGAYLSFLFYYDWERYIIPPEELRLLWLR